MDTFYGVVNTIRLIGTQIENTTEYESTFHNSTSQNECLRSINLKQAMLFYYLLIPAGIIIIILSFLVRRRRAFRTNFLDDRPGIPTPVNCLEEQDNRLSYVAAFGLITWMLYDALFGDDAFDWKHNLYFENFLLLASAFLTGIICYPIFGALSSRHYLGYILGSLYAWTIAIIYILANYPCENYDALRIILKLLWGLPPGLCLFYLSISMPWRVVVWILRWPKRKERQEYLIRNKNLYEVQHVKRLLTFSYMIEKREEAKTLGKRIYHNIKAFRYSISILAAVFVSIQFICMLNLQLIQTYLNATTDLDTWVKHASIILHKLISYEMNVTEATNGTTTVDTAHITLLLLELACRVLKTMELAVIACWCSAFFITSTSLLMSLKRYRAHLLSIYKGDWSYIPKMDDVHPRTLVVSSAKFVGYQLGYAAWGFLVQSTLFIALAVFGIAFILLIAQYDMSFLLVNFAKWAGPLLLYLAFLYVTQIVLTHFCFLQKDERGERVLALDNRRLFFNFHYFMIFGNAGLGVMSSITRVLKAVIYGLWVLPRLDMSTLGREFEQFDSGFSAYMAMLKVENAQTNPILVVFSNLLLEAPPQRKVHCLRKWSQAFLSSERLALKCEHCRRIKRSVFRNRWWVLVTLHNNPSLRLKRKEKVKRGSSGTISKRGSTLFLDVVTDALDLFIQNV